MNEDGEYTNEEDMLKHLDELMDELNEKHGRNKEWERYVAEANLKDALEERMDVIGQNGNDGLHYDESQYPNEKCPDHYNLPIQPWEYMESMMSCEAFIGYLQGNVIKYVSRFQEKGGVADIDKAIHYLQKMRQVF